MAKTPMEFTEQVARLLVYGTEMDHDGDDAIAALNGLIEEARAISMMERGGIQISQRENR